LGVPVGSAAEATRPIDASQRNTTFEAGATVVPDKQSPGGNVNAGVQEQRFETTVIDRKTAPMAGQRAALDVQETREKNVRPMASTRPEVRAQPKSVYNQKKAAISTSGDTKKPPTVTRYQESLAAASASNMARFPALDGATTAKINRFVFRKNPAEPGFTPEGAPVTPAAGGSPVGK
jgi:hypothetical protein